MDGPRSASGPLACSNKAVRFALIDRRWRTEVGRKGIEGSVFLCWDTARRFAVRDVFMVLNQSRSCPEPNDCLDAIFEESSLRFLDIVSINKI